MLVAIYLGADGHPAEDIFYLFPIMCQLFGQVSTHVRRTLSTQRRKKRKRWDIKMFQRFFTST